MFSAWCAALLPISGSTYWDEDGLQIFVVVHDRVYYWILAFSVFVFVCVVALELVSPCSRVRRLLHMTYHGVDFMCLMLVLPLEMLSEPPKLSIRFDMAVTRRVRAGISVSKIHLHIRRPSSGRC